jgi:hypothetical protein
LVEGDEFPRGTKPLTGHKEIVVFPGLRKKVAQGGVHGFFLGGRWIDRHKPGDARNPQQRRYGGMRKKRCNEPKEGDHGTRAPVFDGVVEKPGFSVRAI